MTCYANDMRRAGVTRFIDSSQVLRPTKLDVAAIHLSRAEEALIAELQARSIDLQVCLMRAYIRKHISTLHTGRCPHQL